MWYVYFHSLKRNFCLDILGENDLPFRSIQIKWNATHGSHQKPLLVLLCFIPNNCTNRTLINLNRMRCWNLLYTAASFLFLYKLHIKTWTIRLWSVPLFLFLSSEFSCFVFLGTHVWMRLKPLTSSCHYHTCTQSHFHNKPSFTSASLSCPANAKMVKKPIC